MRPLILYLGPYVDFNSIFALLANVFTSVEASKLHTLCEGKRVVLFDNAPQELADDYVELLKYIHAECCVGTRPVLTRHAEHVPVAAPGGGCVYVRPKPVLEFDVTKILALDANCVCEYCGREFDPTDDAGDIEPGGYCPEGDCPSRDFHAAAPDMSVVLGNVYEFLKSIKAGYSKYSQDSADVLLTDIYTVLRKADVDPGDVPRAPIHVTGESYYGVIRIAEMDIGGDLELTFTPAVEVQLLRDALADRSESAMLIDLLEPITCNDHLAFVRPERIGALTEAPILTNQGDGDDGAEGGAALWWYPQYETTSAAEELITTGRIVFTRAC